MKLQQKINYTPFWKSLIVLAMAAFISTSCSEEARTRLSAKTNAFGKANHVVVIADKDVWEGEIGESLRAILASPVDGLPQEEPLFSMRQMPPSAFEGMSRKGRLFLQIKKGQPTHYEILKNKYARPQLGIVIGEKTNRKIIDILKRESDAIITAFKAQEIREKQLRIAKSLERLPTLNKKLGISIKLPSAYRVAKENDYFFWIRKDIPQGSLNLMLYELPWNSFDADTNRISQIIHLRDSIGAREILTDEGGIFVTEEAYAPYLRETRFLERKTFETKGTWEVKNKFMAGPFVNYTIDDQQHGRWLVLEGFVFAPSVEKRDYMFELEAIIKSLVID